MLSSTILSYAILFIYAILFLPSRFIFHLSLKVSPFSNPRLDLPFLPSFLSFFLPFFLSSFLSFLLPSFLPFFLSSFLSSFFLSSLP